MAHPAVYISLYLINSSFLQYLTEKLTLGKQSSLLGGKTVGDFPCGIPVNIQITGEWCEKIVSINFLFHRSRAWFVTVSDFFFCCESANIILLINTMNTGYKVVSCLIVQIVPQFCLRWHALITVSKLEASHGTTSTHLHIKPTRGRITSVHSRTALWSV